MTLYAPSPVQQPTRFAPQSAFLMGLGCGAPGGSLLAGAYLVTERGDNPRLAGLGCGDRPCAPCAAAGEADRARYADLSGMPLGALGALAGYEFEREISDQEVRDLATAYDAIASAAEPVQDMALPHYAPWRARDAELLRQFSLTLGELAQSYGDAPKFQQSVETAAASAQAVAADSMSGEEAERQRVRAGELREVAIDLRGLAASGVREPFGVDEATAAGALQAGRAAQFRREVARHSFCSDYVGWLGEPGRAFSECVPGWLKLGALALIGLSVYGGLRR